MGSQRPHLHPLRPAHRRHPTCAPPQEPHTRTSHPHPPRRATRHRQPSLRTLQLQLQQRRQDTRRVPRVASQPPASQLDTPTKAPESPTDRLSGANLTSQTCTQSERLRRVAVGLWGWGGLFPGVVGKGFCVAGYFVVVMFGVCAGQACWCLFLLAVFVCLCVGVLVVCVRVCGVCCVYVCSMV